jgi:DNA polymerase III delta prime subunit
MSDSFLTPDAVPTDQLGLAYPQSLSDKYLPKRVSDFIGLQAAKRALAKFVANPYPSAWLFVGPPGTGKTSMALAMANEIPAEVRHVPSRECDLAQVENIAYHCHFMPWTGTKMHLVLVDEANEMTPPAQDAFLSKLDATAFPPNTVFVFTSNSTHRLAERFMSRCRVVDFAGAPNDIEIAEFLKRVWGLEHGENPAPNFTAIARKCEGNIRSALMELELALLGLGDHVADSQPAPLPASRGDFAGLKSDTVAQLLSTMAATIGLRAASTALQNAIRDCGQRLKVDGKVGVYTTSAANRIPDSDLLGAVQRRIESIGCGA